MLPYRILLVDDEADVDELLRAELLPHLPNVTLETAVTEADAYKKIDDAKSAGNTFDVAILDIMLPENSAAGRPRKTNIESFLKTRMADVQVFNVSGNIPEKDLLETNQEYDASILRKEKDGLKTLLRKVRAHLHGKNVADHVKRLQESVPDPDIFLLRGTATSLTQAIQEAEVAVAESWLYLSDTAKQEVHRLFEVDEEHGLCVKLPRLR